ncbi:MAG: cell envelope integrity protein CreD [Taibaiella sp.]|nr:cell envelope integrity protein CreD [Taibaiella sp.]
MEQQFNQQTQSFFEKYKTLAKGFFVGFLVLIMLIPTAYIMVLITERAGRQQEVIKEVSSKWATGQIITGPMLTVPYYTSSTDKEGKTTRTKRTIHILPDQLTINGKVYPEIRHRSLYNVTVYRSSLEFSGQFDPEIINKELGDADSIDWQKASFIMGIDDSRGLEDEPVLTWGTEKKNMETMMAAHEALSEALDAPVNVQPDKKTDFHISLKVKGTGELYFTPNGKTTTVNINSPYATPAFDGKYLPDRIPMLSDSGFSASWKILQASRGYPQYWQDSAYPDFKKSAFGVKLIQQADHYSKTERSVKYAILIISLTFLVFFFLEVIQKRSVHPLQYILVGIALSIFYTLLLSISEYTGFNTAYLVAATATVLLITWYIKAIFGKMRVAAGFMAALTTLYGYVFFLIQLKDYALLFGSIGLFVIVAVIMYYSRRIDWYGVHKTGNDEKA